MPNFRIAPEIISKFPNVQIGYVVADIVNSKTHEHVDALKTSLPARLAALGVTKANFATHPLLAVWDKVFTASGVKPKTYPSSVRALVRRVTDDKPIWNISSIVDLYNCHSVLALAPMGGYDLSALEGDVVLRYGVDGETFIGLGAKETTPVTSKHIVYSDDGGVVCWSWNHKDCERTAILPDTTRAVFFIDCADASLLSADFSMARLIENFSRDLGIIGSSVIEHGIASAEAPEVSFSGSRPRLTI